jgi:hypothetical protein
MNTSIHHSQLQGQDQDSGSFIIPELKNHWSSITESHNQNLSKSQVSELEYQNFSKSTPNSQKKINVPSLTGTDMNITLSFQSDLSAQPTFVDLDILRADQLVKDKTVGR